MEHEKMRRKIASQITMIRDKPIIINRRYLEDEQLVKTEQLAVLEEVFNANVREAEIKELSSHFAPIFRHDHPYHIAIWGKTGTGKTLTLTYFLNLVEEMCHAQKIEFRYIHLDLSCPQPCFRALNDLACLLNASKRYEKGISLIEMMGCIEQKLSTYKGYLILFIDEVDNVTTDKQTFMSFLVRRLQQRIPAKLVLVLVSNRMDWPDHLDPRVKSFLKMNELFFDPYDAVDLQHILRIRVEKALHRNVICSGVIEKIAAIASREHGDARKAVMLLAKSAYIAEKTSRTITLDIVDEAAMELDTDRYLMFLRSAPKQMKATMIAIIKSLQKQGITKVGTGETYEMYRKFCQKVGMRALTSRVFGDLLTELDLYSVIHSRIISRGRYGRTREIKLDLPSEIIHRIEQMIYAHFELPYNK